MATSNFHEILADSIAKILHKDGCELFAMWDEIGYGDEYRKKYLEQFVQNVADMSRDVVVNVQEQRELLRKEIIELKDDISALKLALDGRSSPAEPNVESCFFQLKDNLEKKKVVLLKEKDERIARYESLKLREERASKKMAIPVNLISFTVVPTLEQLNSYEKEINVLEVELAKREKSLEDARSSILLKMSELNYLAKTDFEKDVIAEENFIFSDVNMRGIELLKINLDERLEKMNAEATELRVKIVSLWNLLQINLDEQKLFLEKCSGRHVKYNIKMLQKEFDRCLQLKLESLEKYTKNIREEIRNYWKMMFMEFMVDCSYFQNENFTEDLFEKHLQELECLKKRYEDAAEIYGSLDKRMKLWERKKILEKKEFDPDRYTNRGGKMLPELKEREIIEKQLCKLDGKILSDVAIWEQKNEEKFFVGERQIEDFFKNERDIWEQDKMNLRSEMRAQKESSKTAVGRFKRRRDVNSPLLMRSKITKVDESARGGGVPPIRRLFSTSKKTKIPLRQQVYSGTRENPFSIVSRF